MHIEIEIPVEFIDDFEQDRFEDALKRLILDANSMAGRYERETADMLIHALKNAEVL